MKDRKTHTPARKTSATGPALHRAHKPRTFRHLGDLKLAAPPIDLEDRLPIACN